MNDPRRKLRLAILERNTLATKYSLGQREVYPALCIAEQKVCEKRREYHQWSIENRLLR